VKKTVTSLSKYYHAIGPGYGQDETAEGWQTYWGESYDRLVSLKTKYDPSTLFFPLLGQ